MKKKSEYFELDKYVVKGTVYYYKKNTIILHNPYGPAVVEKSYTAYYINGKLHRLDGPAIIWCNDIQEYWIDSVRLTKEEFEIHPERLKFLGKEHLICLM